MAKRSPTFLMTAIVPGEKRWNKYHMACALYHRNNLSIYLETILTRVMEWMVKYAEMEGLLELVHQGIRPEFRIAIITESERHSSMVTYDFSSLEEWKRRGRDFAQEMAKQMWGYARTGKWVDAGIIPAYYKAQDAGWGMVSKLGNPIPKHGIIIPGAAFVNLIPWKIIA